MIAYVKGSITMQILSKLFARKRSMAAMFIESFRSLNFELLPFSVFVSIRLPSTGTTVVKEPLNFWITSSLISVRLLRMKTITLSIVAKAAKKVLPMMNCVRGVKYPVCGMESFMIN